MKAARGDGGKPRYALRAKTRGMLRVATGSIPRSVNL
jgi:hypothetical protein